MSDAEDAVQEAWLRFSRADASDVENMRGWLTTVVARVCLNVLRARRSRPERSLEGQLPDPIVSHPDAPDPEREALMGEAVGMALLVVLDTLSPAERVAFVLHDVFGIPFDDVAPILGRTPTATRQLASRGRRKVRGSPEPDADLGRQREVAAAFIRASREGDFDALVSLLDPDVVIRVDGGVRAGGSVVLRGAPTVAAQALQFRNLAAGARVVLVNGAVGAVVYRGDRPYSIIGITAVDGRIVEIDIVADPERVARLVHDSSGHDR